MGEKYCSKVTILFCLHTYNLRKDFSAIFFSSYQVSSDCAFLWWLKKKFEQILKTIKQVLYYKQEDTSLNCTTAAEARIHFLTPIDLVHRWTRTIHERYGCLRGSDKKNVCFQNTDNHTKKKTQCFVRLCYAFEFRLCVCWLPLVVCINLSILLMCQRWHYNVLFDTNLEAANVYLSYTKQCVCNTHTRRLKTALIICFSIHVAALRKTRKVKSQLNPEYFRMSENLLAGFI